VLQTEKSLFLSQLVSLEFFINKNSFDRTMALGSTQPLTAFLGVKAAGA